MAKKKEIHFETINGNSQSTSLNTENAFSERCVAPTSPIDEYLSNTQALMGKIGQLERENLLDSSNEQDRHIYNLFLLGFVSNVESYFRSIIREIILLDNCSYESCLEAPLTYAAALHHEKKLLPEALMENHTFISTKNITSAFKDLIGIGINGQDTKTKEVIDCLDAFEQLCQLRHCIVHRAGLLGSKNAIKLGIDGHKNFFEKPISLDLSFLQSANSICLNSVRTSNAYVFNKLIERYVKKHSNSITWKYPTDKSWYLKYHKLFTSQSLNNQLASNSLPVSQSFSSYERFRENLNPN